jgi:hypothetical protein
MPEQVSQRALQDHLLPMAAEAAVVLSDKLREQVEQVAVVLVLHQVMEQVALQTQAEAAVVAVAVAVMVVLAVQALSFCDTQTREQLALAQV